jgi:hypothetical protein
MRENWELENRIRRLELRNLPEAKPKWRWNQKNGKLVRRKGEGIDWYRYQTKVLIPKLIPFTQECAKERPATIVQEDKAPSHTHFIQQRVYDIHSVQRMTWCGNSPDLNAIEPAWPYLKRQTTKRGAPKNRKDATAV